MLVLFSEIVTVEWHYILVLKGLDFRAGSPACASCPLHFTDYAALSKFFILSVLHFTHVENEDNIYLMQLSELSKLIYVKCLEQFLPGSQCYQLLLLS